MSTITQSILDNASNYNELLISNSLGIVQAENKSDIAEHITDDTSLVAPQVQLDSKMIKRNNFGIMGMVSW